MKEYTLFRQDSNTGNFPPPPPPPPSFNPPPPTSYNTGSSGGASSNAVIALVLGILSFIACGILAAIPAWIIGKKELNAINAGQSPQAGRTMAKIGMWLGIINIILSIFTLIILGILMVAGIFNFNDYR